MVLEKGEGEEQKHKKRNVFFLCKKRAVFIFSGNHSFSLKHPRSHTASFLVLLISNTSVKCRSYIYLYSMKELKMFFFSRTIYSIMNSNRHENIHIIMMQTSQEKLSPVLIFPSRPSRPITRPNYYHVVKANTRYSFMLLS